MRPGVAQLGAEQNDLRRVVDPYEQHDDRAMERYLQAFAKLEAGDPGALAAFAAEVSKRSDDHLASFHNEVP